LHSDVNGRLIFIPAFSDVVNSLMDAQNQQRIICEHQKLTLFIFDRWSPEFR